MATLTLVLGLVGLLLASTRGHEEIAMAKRRLVPDLEERRQGSGLDFMSETRVDRAPRAGAAEGFDAERVWSGNDDWEPHLAADRNEPFVYQFTTRWIAPNYRIVTRRSVDGGATWEADAEILPGNTGQADPYAKVADDGTVYAIWLEIWDTVLSKSSDHGLTWSAPVSTIGDQPWSDYPSLAISGSGQDVYVAFNTAHSYVSASHDFGETFSEPIRTDSDNRYWYAGGGAVAPDGTAYFAASATSAFIFTDTDHTLLRSTDGGASWQTIQVERAAENPKCDFVPDCDQGFLVPTMGVAVDEAGTLLVAYPASNVDEGPQRMWARSSTDRGETWSPRMTISIPASDVTNAFPSVTAGPTAGDFRVLWQSSSPGLPGRWNAWYRRTLDGGVTWGDPVRLSDEPDGAPYKHPEGFNFPYGDYLASSVGVDGMNHFVWGAGRSYNGPGGTWYTRGLETESAIESETERLAR